MITHDQLKELVHYDPETGVFYAKRTYKKWIAGRPVGTTRNTGYKQLCLFGKVYLAHRVAWFYVHGAWPTHGLDHINRDRGDNRIANLREATQAQNHQNRSGVRGFSRSAAKSERWVAQICVNKKTVNLGSFATQEEARAAYAAAKLMLHTFNPHATENLS